jgi:hypothetical protein
MAPEEGELPGWTLLMPLAWCIVSVMIIWASKEAGFLWQIGTVINFVCKA